MTVVVVIASIILLFSCYCSHKGNHTGAAQWLFPGTRIKYRENYYIILFQAECFVVSLFICVNKRLMSFCISAAADVFSLVACSYTSGISGRAIPEISLICISYRCSTTTHGIEWMSSMYLCILWETFHLVLYNISLWLGCCWVGSAADEGE